MENQLWVEVRARIGSKGACGGCGKRGPTYDTARSVRSFQFVPMWGIAVYLSYGMRRIDCLSCGVVTERVPWADGKNQCCNVYRLFLARWARRLSWSEVAEVFATNFGVVHRAVQWVVDYGMQHRSLDGVTAIGVDEVQLWKGHKYLTVVYQIDQGARRLLWVGRERTEKTFHEFFTMFGETRTKAIEFVASDMWKPYLNVIRKRMSGAVHVLDRFHIVAKLNKAIDEVRAQEARHLKRKGFVPVLKHSRFCFLKRKENLTDKQKLKLDEVMQYSLRTVRAYVLKEAFEGFWSYTSPYWAGWFLDAWCKRAMRSRLPPIKKFATTLRNHRELLLNWFKAKKQISSGCVEGLNTNVKLTLRKARGFKSYHIAETALYHVLGKLPEPEFTHRFC